MSESRILHESEYSVVKVEPALRLVTFTRTARRIADIEEGRKTFGVLTTLDVGDADVLLSDLRAAPGNNSPEWEKLFDEAGRRFFFARFRRRAALVSTAAGMLQVERIARGRGERADQFRCFTDEAAARRWLLE